jgi:hypothetical protein
LMHRQRPAGYSVAEEKEELVRVEF